MQSCDDLCNVDRIKCDKKYDGYNNMLFAEYCLLFAIYYLLFAVCCLLFAVCSQHTVYSLLLLLTSILYMSCLSFEHSLVVGYDDIHGIYEYNLKQLYS